MGSRKYDIGYFKSIAQVNGGQCLSDTYKSVNKKLHWECKLEHQWWSSPRNIINGSWCKKCSSINAAEQLKKNLGDCKKLAAINQGLCLSTQYINSQSKLVWKCKNGHTWGATYANVKKGTWCKICSIKETSKKRRTPLSYFQLYAISLGGICLSNSYSNQKDRLTFKCAKGHTWSTMASVIKNNNAWCPICAQTYRANTPELQEIRINEIKDIASRNGGECLSNEYINQKTKLQFRCKYGHEWWTVPSVIKSGHWCKMCSTKVTSDIQRDDINIFKKIIELKGGKLLTTKYTSQQKTRLLVECEKGHSWLAFPQHIKRGLWCRKCNGSSPHTLEDVKNLAESRGGKCLSTYYKNDMTKILWQCSENHTWQATPNNIKRGKWCPTCSSGIGERVCRLSFEKIFKKRFNRIRPIWLRNSLGYVLELDGYNEELKLAFEHQGTQHYSSKINPRFSKRNLKRNDEEKAQICKRLGIQIIYIPEVFTDTKLNQVITYILNELDKKGINYQESAKNISLDPMEVYTYTKTRELELRELRAREILINNEAEIIRIYRINSGVRIKFKCKKKHVLTKNISAIINGKICEKCADVK